MEDTMQSVRKISKVWKGKPVIEGAGVHLKRAFGYHEVPLFDPFLMLDDFHSNYPPHYLQGFPWHPHRGIETITYVLHGRVEHADSMGNEGVIASGDVQWMTAGSGVIHQEMPKGDNDGLMWGFQLWANLPASRKMMDPRYRGIVRKEIPEVTLEGGIRVKVVCGEVGGVKGPVQDVVVSPTYLDVTVPPETTFTHPAALGHRVFAYVVDGQGYFDPDRDAYAHEVAGDNYFDLKRQCACSAENIILYGDGAKVVITAQDRPVRFLLISGRPIGEPVAWYGPIVMNTQEELRIAFQEYEKGAFIKHE
jgi:hypothetical protein